MCCCRCWYSKWNPAQQHTSKIRRIFLLMLIFYPLLLLLLLLVCCFNRQGVGAVWRRDYSSVLRVPTCSLPSMATFVGAGKPNFRVTSTRDPAPLISYHTDSWAQACSQNSLASAATSHTHEMRASVIMKTSDVTSSWPLTPDEGVLSLLPEHRICLFSPSGLLEA